MTYVTSQRSPEQREPIEVYRHDPVLRRQMLFSRLSVIMDLRPELLDDPAVLTEPPEPSVASEASGYGPYGYDMVLANWNRLATEIVASEAEIREAFEAMRDRPSIDDWVEEDA